MIDPTAEMVIAAWDALPVSAQDAGLIDLDDMRVVLAAVLAIVERDWNMQPRPDGSHLHRREWPSGRGGKHPHFCVSCSDGEVPGPGCDNCRSTGMDQTPWPTCEECAR